VRDEKSEKTKKAATVKRRTKISEIRREKKEKARFGKGESSKGTEKKRQPRRRKIERESLKKT